MQHDKGTCLSTFPILSIKVHTKGGVFIMAKIKDITGQRFGRLVAIKRCGKNSCGQSLWEYQCDCGKTIVTVARNSLKSCGCLNRELFEQNKRKPVHGMYKTRQFSIWHSMKQRCLNPNKSSYKYYGGRGINVCDKWLTFEGFWEDMQLDYSDELTIDRIDVNGNYEPSNCRWATNEEQASNKSTNIILTIDGLTKTFKQHCKSHGINYSTAINRVARHGYTYEDAVKIPTKEKYASKN